eukprot:COSAG02_NODE_30208_length_555_cov_1.127193_1_plen_171_part_10
MPADAFRCTCTAGFRGKTCDQDVNECLSAPCQNGAICQDLVDDYSCDCHPTFDSISQSNRYWGGKECADALTHENACHNGGQEAPNLSCICAPGWAGNTCDDDVDECLSQPCGDHGSCTTPGVNYYRCNCDPGYAGDNCEVDVDECQSHPCEHPSSSGPGCVETPAMPDTY